MDARTRDLLINTALKVAYDATGFFPVSSQVKAGLEIARDAAPAVEALVEWAQSPAGQEGIAKVRAVFDAVQTTSGEPVNWTMGKAIDALEAGNA